MSAIRRLKGCSFRRLIGLFWTRLRRQTHRHGVPRKPDRGIDGPRERHCASVLYCERVGSCFGRAGACSLLCDQVAVFAPVEGTLRARHR
jgi:hypothetical protein